MWLKDYDRYFCKIINIPNGNIDKQNFIIVTPTNDGFPANSMYHKVSNIRGTLVGNEIVDHSDVVGASPVGAAPTTSSFST